MHPPRGLAAVRDAVLGLGRPFAQGLASGRLSQGLEDGVVAKAAVALGRDRDAAFACAVSETDGQAATRATLLRQDQRQYAAIPGAAPLGREAAQRPQQLDVVVLVRGRLAGVALRVDAGSAAEVVHFETGVVGEGGEAG